MPEPITLEIFSPADGIGIEVNAVRILGTTSANAVTINGGPVNANTDGQFEFDLTLRDGVNLIEIVASDSANRSVSRQIVVFSVASTAGLPFSLTYPPDGHVSDEPLIKIVGVTRPDVVVGVNQVSAEVNALGIFESELPLEEGDNLIEVVAVDIKGNVRFQTVVVFYFP